MCRLEQIGFHGTGDLLHVASIPPTKPQLASPLALHHPHAAIYDALHDALCDALRTALRDALGDIFGISTLLQGGSLNVRAYVFSTTVSGLRFRV